MAKSPCYQMVKIETFGENAPQPRRWLWRARVANSCRLGSLHKNADWSSRKTFFARARASNEFHGAKSNFFGRAAYSRYETATKGIQQVPKDAATSKKGRKSINQAWMQANREANTGEKWHCWKDRNEGESLRGGEDEEERNCEEKRENEKDPQWNRKFWRERSQSGHRRA